MRLLTLLFPPLLLVGEGLQASGLLFLVGVPLGVALAVPEEWTVKAILGLAASGVMAALEVGSARKARLGTTLFAAGLWGGGLLFLGIGLANIASGELVRGLAMAAPGPFLLAEADRFLREG